MKRGGSAVAAFLKAISHPVSLLSRRAGWGLGDLLGGLWRIVDSRHRSAADENVARAFPTLSSAQREALVRGVFSHLGRTAIEFVSLSSYNAASLRRYIEDRVRFEGLDIVRSFLDRQQGGFILTAHCGNWELLGLALAVAGLPMTIVARPLDSPSLNEWVDGVRGRLGSRVVGKKRVLRPILEDVGAGRWIGILLDQNVAREEGVFVPFFGVPACTTKGLALMAIKTGAPVVPAIIRREDDGTHRVVFHPPIGNVPAGDREESVRLLTAAYTKKIEEEVRAHPEQWFWVHRRWKTRPDSRNGEWVSW
ncbi:MAG: lysophospholipid acyltransferase family protein [Nitrospirae bacterium]|nr:lysophospholipid acyltransferase family protein [Nitrospirota bacterium]